MQLNKKAYDITKKVVQVVSPAVVTLVLALGGTWSWDPAEKVAGTITIITTFVGVILQLSSSSYQKSDAPLADAMEKHGYDGEIFVNTAGQGQLLNVALEKPEEELVGKDAVVFKIQEINVPPAA